MLYYTGPIAEGGICLGYINKEVDDGYVDYEFSRNLYLPTSNGYDLVPGAGPTQYGYHETYNAWNVLWGWGFGFQVKRFRLTISGSYGMINKYHDKVLDHKFKVSKPIEIGITILSKPKRKK